VAACARASGRVGRNGTPKIAPHPARLRLRESLPPSPLGEGLAAPGKEPFFLPLYGMRCVMIESTRERDREHADHQPPQTCFGWGMRRNFGFGLSASRAHAGGDHGRAVPSLVGKADRREPGCSRRGRWPSCLTASSQWDAGPISPASPPILEQPGRWPTTSSPPGIRAPTTRATGSPRSAELRVSPQARNSVDRDGRPACCGSASCIQICPIGAKYDATVHLSSAEEWRCHPRPDDCHESRNRRRRQRQCDQLQALGRQRRCG
jgi:hypothetical protein